MGEEIVMVRPYVELKVTVNGYIGKDGKFVTASNGPKNYEIIGLNLVTRRITSNVESYNTLDKGGANKGYIFPPATFEGSFSVVINGEKVPMFMRQLIDIGAISDITVKESTKKSAYEYEVLKNVVITNESFEITETLDTVPVVRYDYTCLGIERHYDESNVVYIGDGWERYEADQRSEFYNKAW